MLPARCQQPRTIVEEVRARGLDSPGGGSGQRMAADELQSGREGGGSVHDRPLRASVSVTRARLMCSGRRCERRDVLQHGRREHHQVRAGDDPQILAALVDDASVERCAETGARSTAAIAIAGQRRLTASAKEPPINPSPTMAMRVKGG
jgi:hypothetical protein